MYPYVIFDLDGTLLNTIDDLANAGNHVCRLHGWPTHSVDEFKRMVGNGIPKLVERFAPEGTGAPVLEQALGEFMAWYGVHKADQTAPYPGMLQAVRRLKEAGVSIAVLSNKADEMAGPVVEGYYPQIFPLVQGALTGIPTKPDPTLLHRLMERMGASQENTLFVGDSNVDIQTAKNGGLTSCGVLWGFRSRQELEQEGADYLASTPEDLLTLILGEKGGRETRHLGPEDVEEEVKILAEEGYKEIVLTGIHLTSYGIDFKDEGIDFLTLIKRLHEIDGIERIRFGSLEPRVITEEFASELSRLPKICPHFHLSLQSGCDDTLKRMNRHYTCKEYADRCEILRKHFRNPAITTDVIVGFPAETDADFETTRRFLEKVHFYEMHVFPYSRRAGTRADRMPDQVPEPVKKERSAVLLKLEKKMSGEYRSSFAGTEQEILLEEPVTINDEIYMTGYTKEYVKAAIRLDGRDPKALKNTFVSGILGDFLTEEILLLNEK